MTKKSEKATKTAALPLSTSENPNEVSVGHGVIDCYDVYVVRSSGKPELVASRFDALEALEIMKLGTEQRPPARLVMVPSYLFPNFCMELN